SRRRTGSIASCCSGPAGSARTAGRRRRDCCNFEADLFGLESDYPNLHKFVTAAREFTAYGLEHGQPDQLWRTLSIRRAHLLGLRGGTVNAMVSKRFAKSCRFNGLGAVRIFSCRPALGRSMERCDLTSSVGFRDWPTTTRVASFSLRLRGRPTLGHALRKGLLGGGCS